MAAKFTSYRPEVESEIDKAIAKSLEIVGGTAERHAKDICPVDTGRLRNSIAHEPVGDNTESIGTDVEYAPYVELGTRYQSPQPYLRPGVENYAEEYAGIIKNELSKV